MSKKANQTTKTVSVKPHKRDNPNTPSPKKDVSVKPHDRSKPKSK